MSANFTRSICDMRELYSLLVEKCPNNIPTVIVVEDMSGVPEGMTHFFCTTKPNDNNITLVFGEDDLKDMRGKVLPYLEELKNIDIEELQCIPVLGIPLAHRKEVYRHAATISEKLEIVCPQIVPILENAEEIKGSNAARKTFYDPNVIDKDIPIGDYIFIRNRGLSRMVHSIAHELRHCWQEYKSWEWFYKNYKTLSQVSVIEHANQPEEIDAEAYASLFVEKYLGVQDGTTLMFETPEDAEGWEELISKVKKRMKQITV